MKRLIDRLKNDEGFSRRSYYDTRGIETIGYGYNLKANMLGLTSVELAYYYQHGITKLDAENILNRCVKSVASELDEKYAWFEQLNQARKDALINMAFNLGIVRFGKFVKMIAYLADGDWQGAAGEMLDSKWSHDVGKRCVRISALMGCGYYPDED